jgi:hypothetical protein
MRRMFGSAREFDNAEKKKTDDGSAVAVSDGDLDAECSERQDVLSLFRSCRQEAADRPAFFWKTQHNAVMKRIDKPAFSLKFRRPLLWGCAAAAVLLCLVLFTAGPEVPVPDIAAGYDHDLLLEVERAIDRDCPVALEPVDLLAREIEP